MSVDADADHSLDDWRPESIVIVGAGLMGRGIAVSGLTVGVRTTLVDLSADQLASAREEIEQRVAKFAAAEHAPKGDGVSASEQVTYEGDLDRAAATADFLIEAVPEQLSTKKDLIHRLDEVCGPDVVIASNTSQIPITSLAHAAKRYPSRVCGMHFFSPAHAVPLVEVATGSLTTPGTRKAVLQLAGQLGKRTVECKDRQGFITSRLIASWVNEAFRLVEEGVASEADVDLACRLAFKHPGGPLELADFAGLDTFLSMLESLSHAYGDRFLPTQTHRRLVDAGHYGRKSGQGVYTYEGRDRDRGR